MNIEERIKKDTNNADDIIYKKINISNHEVYLIYSEVLTSGISISDFILKNIAFLIDENKKIDDIYNFLYNSIPSHNVKKIEKYEDVIYMLFNGFAIFSYDNNYFAIEIRAVLDRGINKAENELSIRGPKDGFCENYNKNLGLIRRRIKSEKLWSETFELGKLTKTKTGVLYMSNIADKKQVNYIVKELKKINIDGIIDSSYLANYIVKDSKIFPTIETTERPDLVSMALLEGKIVIMIDTSPYALILPTFFIDFFKTPDDYYQKNINVTFIRIIRLMAFIIAIFLPAYYIAVTTHNTDSITIDLLLNLIEQRKNVSFPGIAEALIMSISFEILRESDMRMTSTIGSAISILGGLILGDALVSAGIISPIMIIVVATSAISGLIFPSLEMSNAIRFYRIFLIILASILGIFGIYIGLILLITNLSSIKTLGYDYLSPFSPYIKEEQQDSLIKINKKGKKTRNPLIAKNNKIRGENN